MRNIESQVKQYEAYIKKLSQRERVSQDIAIQDIYNILDFVRGNDHEDSKEPACLANRGTTYIETIITAYACGYVTGYRKATRAGKAKRQKSA